MQALTLARLACGHPQVGSSVATWKLSVYHHLDPSPATTPPTSRICLHLLFFFLPSFFLRGGTVGLGRILSGALRRPAEGYRGPARTSIERRKERRARRRACEGGSGPEVLVNLRVPCPCHPQVWGGHSDACRRRRPPRSTSIFGIAVRSPLPRRIPNRPQSQASEQTRGNRIVVIVPYRRWLPYPERHHNRRATNRPRPSHAPAADHPLI